MDNVIDVPLARTHGPAPERLIEIDAQRKPTLVDLVELWHFRDLILLLGLRDFQVRYRQTVVGVLWVLFQPVAYAVVLSPILGNTSPQSGPNPAPYWLVVFTGLIPWQLFAGTVSVSAACLIANQGLLTKVYFPRIILPLAASFVVLVDFLVASGVMLLLVGINRGMTWEILLAPLFVGWILIAAIGIGTGLSALNALYRDVSSLIPFFLQLGIFASPVFYDAALIPENWRLPFALNPMTTTIRGFRWALLQTSPPGMPEILVSGLATCCFVVLGLWYFQRTERLLADVI